MLKNILSYGVIEGIAKGLNKSIILALPLFIDTISFGKIGLLISFELILPFVSLLGFERAVLRFNNKRNDLLHFNKTISISIFMIHGLMIFLLMLIYLFGYKTFFGLNLFPDIFLIILLVYFQGSNLITLNILRVDEKHIMYFKARLFLQITKFILVLSLISSTGSYLGYLYGGITAALITNLFFRIKKPEGDIELFNKKTFLSLIVFSWPFVFHGIAGNLLSNADKFILANYMSMYDVGLYSLVYSISSMMLFVYIGISAYMEPIIYKENVSYLREKLLFKYKIISIGLGIIAYVIICLLSIFVLPQLYAKRLFEEINYIPILSITYLIYPYYLQSSYIMIFNNKSLNIAIISIICALINICLNIIFIPMYGIYGAVIITFVSYLIQSFLFVIISSQFKFTFQLIELLILGIIISFFIYLNLPFYYSIIPLLFFFGFIFIKQNNNLRIHQ